MSSITIIGENYNVNCLVLLDTDSLTPVFGFIVEIFPESIINTIGFIIKVVTTICMYPHMYCYVVDLRKWGPEVVAPKSVSNIGYVSAFDV